MLANPLVPLPFGDCDYEETNVENLPGKLSFTGDDSGKTYVAALDLHDLVLTVTVESSPLDGVWVLTTPVPNNILASMCHSEITTLVRMR